MEYRRQGHCVYYTEYHLVISTKYRRKIFNEGVKEYFKVILKRIGEYYPEVKVTEVNTDRDHAHEPTPKDWTKLKRFYDRPF